jgi:ribonuclease VapC
VIVIDASAIVAILSREPECDAMIAALERSYSAVTSPIAVYEATLGLRRKRFCSVAEAENDVLDFLVLIGAEVSPLDRKAAHDALEAFSRFGKGTQHPAQLNLGDCFAYAQAKAFDAPLLFKGDDFTKTDIPTAV